LRRCAILSVVRVSINSPQCQGHGRCYDLAPGVFSEDDEGYGQAPADGVVSPGSEPAARLAEANCPEHAISLEESST
jgi:ferredoxin